jgi:hypothetical protein
MGVPPDVKGPLIVRDAGEDADEQATPQRKRDRRLRELAPLAYPAIVLAASVIAFAAHHVKHRQPSAPSPTARAVPHFLFGDLQAEGPAPPSHGKHVCIEEERADPVKGPWTCGVWEPLQPATEAAVAADPGGRCTARSADQLTGSWKCRSRKPLITYGDLRVRPRSRKDETTYGRYRTCIQERRASPTRGAWRCVMWTDPPQWEPIHEPRDSGAPCMQRIANQDTGKWDCFQKSRGEITPLPGPRTSYRGSG